MTDLEITKRCAKAMGGAEICNWERGDYNPLHDDAQAMALVKKFHIHLWHDTKWAAQVRHRTDTQAIANDLNRAICECVARLQEGK